MEVALTSKFRGLVENLRERWKTEDLDSTCSVKKRLRLQYVTVIKQMRTQLMIAQALQSEIGRDIADSTTSHFKCAAEFVCKPNLCSVPVMQTGLSLARLGGPAHHSRLWRARQLCSKWRVDLQSSLLGQTA